ncbi:Hypothetical protein POVR2_LOCUS200 [uncultured virus]|nr:Hypothetical protein POVR2_LOCUS200 [uncultured virus]
MNAILPPNRHSDNASSSSDRRILRGLRCKERRLIVQPECELRTVLDAIYKPYLHNLDLLREFVLTVPMSKLEGQAIEGLVKLRCETLDVLVWLLDNDYIERSQRSLELLAQSATLFNSRSTLKYLLQQIKQSDLPVNLLDMAVENDCHEALSLLIDLFSSAIKPRDLLIRAASASRYNSVYCAFYRLKSKLTEDDLGQALIASCSNTSIENGMIVRFLLDKLAELTQDVRRYIELAWKEVKINISIGALEHLILFASELEVEMRQDLLAICIATDSSEMIPSVLKYADPSLDNNEALFRSVVGSHLECTRELLLDSRVDPSAILTELAEYEEELDPAILALLAQHVTLYSRTLSFIAIDMNRKQSSASLLDWMISQREGQFGAAAQRVLANRPISNWIEALMAVALYKMNRLDDVLKRLECNETERTRTVKILNAYLCI